MLQDVFVDRLIFMLESFARNETIQRRFEEDRGIGTLLGHKVDLLNRNSFYFYIFN